jgi:hypothetical protein
VDAPTGRQFTALTDKTFLPIGLVTVAIAACCGGAWWLSAMYANQVQVNNRLDRIEKAIAENASSSVSEKDMRTWVTMLRNENKAGTISVPEWVR